MLSLSQIYSISNSFNNFFVDVGPKLASNIKHSEKDYFDYLLNSTQKSLFMKLIVADKNVKIVSKLNQNKIPGHDGILNLNVKKVASIIAKPLTDIFNLSLSSGIVPEQTKLVKVMAIYKKRGSWNILKLPSCICITLLFQKY